GFLWLAVRRIELATYADVEMCIMPPEGPDLAQPAPVAGYRFAQLLLDSRVDENPLPQRIARSPLQQPGVNRIPPPFIKHIFGAGLQQGYGFHLFARRQRIGRRRHRPEPHVGIEADLVRGMTRAHRPAPWLRNVAHEKAVPA